MPRRAATLTQADIARAIRAAKQAGAVAVDVKPDGTVSIRLADNDNRPPPREPPQEPPPPKKKRRINL